MKKQLIFLLTITLLGTFTSQAQEDTTVLLEKAYEQATKENKHVFVKFSASWCGWCKRMDKNMKADATKDLFNDNYVTVQLVVNEAKGKKKLENPGSLEFLTKYGGERAGLPFFLILDNEGNLLEDSFNEKKQNLGCPASPEEVAAFIEMLKKTSNLNEKQLAVISETFILKK